MNNVMLAVVSASVLFGSALGLAASPDKMVLIPGGTFTMGNDKGEKDERPAHRVTVKSFWLDKFPVTNDDFAAFLNAWKKKPRVRDLRVFDLDDSDARIRAVRGVHQSHAGFGNHPVVESTWYGAREFCRWKGKRLPTEAEWEFAARGKEGRLYPWGEEPPEDRAQYGKGWGETLPVGTPASGATPEGVFNMAGNVHEWTSSLYEPYPYRADDGRENPDVVEMRVTRGGAADTHITTLQATWRGGYVSRNPWAGHHNIGFRCAKSADR